VLDEKIPLKYGLIGQETTGPGGMMKALRTIPVMLDIARDVQRINPEAWIVNYTNPTGLVAEAVNKHTEARIAGLCSGGLMPRDIAAGALDVPAESVRYDYVGLNHLNFAFNFSVDGRRVTDEEFARIVDSATWGGALNATLLKTLRLIPIPYLQYYYHTSKKTRELKEQEHTRGEQVQMLEAEAFRDYADPAKDTKPEALARRGGGGYSEVALSVMKAIYTNRERIVIVNVPEVPRAVWGLIAAVKNYEQLAVEAAVTGSRETALLALMAHPLVQDYEIAVPLLDELLEANRQYLPQFFS